LLRSRDMITEARVTLREYETIVSKRTVQNCRRAWFSYLYIFFCTLLFTLNIRQRRWGLYMARHHMAGTADRSTRMLISRCSWFLRDTSCLRSGSRASRNHVSFETKRNKERKRGKELLKGERSDELSSKDHPNVLVATIGNWKPPLRFYGNVSTIGRYQMANCCALEKIDLTHCGMRTNRLSFYGDMFDKGI